VASSNGSKFYNRGIATLTLESGPKRLLYEYKNGDVCSYIADAAFSDQLFDLIEKTVYLADRADAQECPNYRP
jgi:hypothetical protein